MRISIFKPFLLTIVCVVASAVILTSFSALAQNRKQVPLELKNSEVSFEGDDSFITKRVTWEPLADNFIWLETLYFRRGLIRYGELVSDYFFTGVNQGKDVFIRAFNNTSAMKNKGLNVSEHDVKKGSAFEGDYFYVTKSNGSNHCGVAKIFGGDRAGSMVNVGNKSATIYSCWTASDGSVSELENSLKKIMKQIRLDDGKLNKIKALSPRTKSVDVEKNSNKPLSKSETSPVPKSNTSDESIVKRLRRLKTLFDMGIITKEEADEQRKKILDNL
jgi:hypothetical protein